MPKTDDQIELDAIMQEIRMQLHAVGAAANAARQRCHDATEEAKVAEAAAKARDANKILATLGHANTAQVGAAGDAADAHGRARIIMSLSEYARYLGGAPRTIGPFENRARAYADEAGQHAAKARDAATFAARMLTEAIIAKEIAKAAPAR